LVWCTRRHCAVAPAGDAASTTAAVSISADPSHAAEFKLTIARLRLDKFHRFINTATCLRRLK
jgi:hypothetical protein